MHRKDKLASRLMAKNHESSELWTTKYFPSNLDEVPLYRKAQTENFIRILDQSFVGPPWHPRVGMVVGPVGCGKTTLVKAVCRSKNIEIVQFSPDDDYDKPFDREDEMVRMNTGGEKPLMNALILFLERAQLVTTPGKKQLVLIDDLTIDRNDRRRFIEILENYGCDRRRLFPLFWIPDPDGASQKPENCIVFNFPAASHSVLKRVIQRVSRAEGLQLNSQQFEEVIAGNPGDVRLAVNQLQLTRDFSTGGYDMLTFFQAVGEVLYNKQKRTAEDILTMSHCSPRMIITALYENSLDFFDEMDDYGDAADFLSEADVLMKESWQNPDLGTVAATTAMRGMMVSNQHRVSNTFWSLRTSKKSRLRMTMVEENASYLCWPSPEMTSERMDFLLFTDKRSYEYIEQQKREKQNVTTFTESELAEAMALLEIDPIDNEPWDDTF